ncbi:LPS O-antigen chain length determinant protein WzzB [Vibrio cyclitrophicus]|uniref:LPS O-antigen chain length determinant protein WzzB n=1 Tax=Vibrio cyclitrophicus TaxID=47951 RepID=UPI0002EFB2B4|nr:Wzz/FepE/Etk N-terminal domain-containing protein [Vibrio cyclitrophicus]OED65378.1 chain-length determining protein [Vibrio cyclitrophicus ZF99]OED75325.1 chain-length determining protein [Vibrio cyclitrophicus ZF65]PME10671.1 chain-length determining protein [Vibrio cyclitrophicus]PME40641.1 chain-length determining protein [Vibrio cyclitrophicus]PME44661.1 chain-length determining protein [Vibrio cyclitrophicus]
MKQHTSSQQYSAESHPQYIPNDEIDVRTLVKVLWREKLLIIVVTAIFTICSVALALTSQEWWSSNAKIAASQSQNIEAYQQQVKKFQPIFNVYQDDGTVLISKELNKLISSERLFQDFIDTFNSSNNKRIFLESSPEFNQLNGTTSLSDVNSSEGKTKLPTNVWFEKITSSIANKGNKSSPYFVHFQSMSKESSSRLLSSYISFTEAKVQQDAFNNLQAAISSKSNELLQQKKILESQAKSQLQVETERAKYAMDIALAAGVEKPVLASNDNEIFDINLGFKGLKAKINALESVNNLSVIEPRLQQINAKLEMLANLKIDRNIKFQTFRFLNNVEQAVSRDEPKRVLMVLFGAALGIIMSLIIVFIRFTLKKKD